MSKKGYLLVDGNNIGFAAASMGKLTVGGREVQGIHHFLGMLRPYIARFPQLVPVVLWDGISWRYNAFPTYKATREKTPETKSEIQAAATRASFKTQRVDIKKALRLLGVQQMVSMNLEADDLAAILLDRYTGMGKKVYLVSGDRDWLQLLKPNTAVLDPIRKDVITPNTFAEKVGYMKTRTVGGVKEDVGFRGVPSPAAWLDVKCLAGDSSDEIEGVGGIGEIGAIEMVIKFGSVSAFMNQANLEKLPLPKKLADFASDENKWALYQRNRMLMDLRSKLIPKPEGLKVDGGRFDQPAFAEFCAELAFQRILSNLDEWCEPFRPTTATQEQAA